MDQYRLDSHNAMELYMRGPAREKLKALLGTFGAWPFMERTRHAGIILAAIDVYLHLYGSAGWSWRLGRWFFCKGCAPTRSTWNDYWMCVWNLAPHAPELRARAIAELHRRGWHLDYSNPQWRQVMETALWMIFSVCQQNPVFRLAMIAEIAGTSCATHPGIPDVDGRCFLASDTNAPR